MLNRDKVRKIMGRDLTGPTERLWSRLALPLAMCETDAEGDDPEARVDAAWKASELVLGVYRSDAVPVLDRNLLLIYFADLAPNCHDLWAELFPHTYPRCPVAREGSN